MADNTPAVDPNNLGDVVARKTEDQGWQHPLIEFEGRFMEFPGEMKQTKSNPPREFLAATMKFTDVNVIESRWAYTFPTAEINITHSESPTSNFGVLGNSIAVITGEDTPFSSLFGKMLRMKFTEGHTTRRPTKDNPGKDDWEDYTRACWEVVAIEGIDSPVEMDPDNNGNDASATNDLEAAIKLADGKDVHGFSKAVLTETGVSETLKAKAIQGEEEVYLGTLVGTGALTKDDAGVYHAATPANKKG